MTPNYLRPNRGRRETGLYIFAALWFIAVMWLIIGSVITSALQQVLPTAPWANFIIAFSGFIPMLVACLLAMKLYGRSMLSVVTTASRFSVRTWITGFLGWAALLLMSSLIGWFTDPSSMRFSFDAFAFFPALLVCLVLLPVQTAAEELLFRGVIAQALSRAISSNVVVAVVGSLLFALPHLLNPEAQGAPVASLIAYFSIGFGWQWAAIRLGSLEIALGAHLANNFFDLFVIGYEDSAVKGVAVWTTPPTNMNSAAVASVLTCGVWMLLSERIARRRDLQTLSNS